MNRLFRHWRWALLMLLALGAFGGAGCATSAEDENMSARPWNTPEGFDYSMPGGMFNQVH
ncbi:MAG TPA: hypothetical protein VMU04_16815 [Candidatus Acidoferrum sp.]|nr:hypothetical protein [Candidatus Acidoferrum sp.]